MFSLERLIQREQGSNEEFRNYFYDKLILIREFDKNMKIDDKIIHIVRGCKPNIKREIKRYLYDNKPENDDDLFRIVSDIEDLDFSEWTSSVSRKNVSFNETDKSKADYRMDKLEKIVKGLKDQIFYNRNFNNGEGTSRNNYEMRSAERRTDDRTTPKEIQTNNSIKYERTTDNRPICTKCNRTGHIIHTCYARTKYTRPENKSEN